MNKNKKDHQPKNTTQKFLEAQAKHNKAAKKHIDYDSSSEEESPSDSVLGKLNILYFLKFILIVIPF